MISPAFFDYYMSKRSEIINGQGANTMRSGLIYTCQCGWIDLGHARPDNARDNLWLPLLDEIGIKSKNKNGFKIQFSEGHSRLKINHITNFLKEIYVPFGLNRSQKESVALSVFVEVSIGLENLQSNFIYRRITDSGFSSEDLVSDLVGFYRAVKPGVDYISACQPVSKEAGLKVWDTYGAVGDNKNYFFGPFLYPCSECRSNQAGPMCGQLPQLFNSITPAQKGELYRDWSSND